ncbi:MAG: phosphohydrolase [Candidatus Wallbacteria bacterium HGW-Wallbacteria-1]|jgi:HD-GYP domain-containing protein (c-di-GMP phosphodiesterase class II)|uniref:Phosphohydrolase n=1 Tax=Candidatus Wallbacteria bacterium HGW-Wallbacteria-1 TaxID=2013854 RepID=A0A2N1PMQ1_9BACT|nr:MAG: phosphohydrolase [Candidatus Wallbacteria bacterium HGW-Wallbacteria-1]
MIKEMRIPVFDLAMCLSKVLDLVSPDLVDHHVRVAYVAHVLAGEAGFAANECDEIAVAGLLHDCGAFSLSERLDVMRFEVEDPHHHGEVGYRLLSRCGRLEGAACLIRHHHRSWSDNAELADGDTVSRGSYLLHLADRIVVLVSRNGHILDQARKIEEIVSQNPHGRFCPDFLEAARRVMSREYFWFDLISKDIPEILKRRITDAPREFDLGSMLEFAQVVGYIIDFRSRFTATHSRGVSASAEAIAERVGFSPRECMMMRIAGYFHDLGKLAVPNTILEKPDRLVNDEFNIIRGHTYHTFRVMQSVPDLEEMAEWAAFHHERLNGMGYPFHHDASKLSLGARVMAVADVFTAICEDRPYRPGMETEKALKVLRQMGSSGVLDPKVVEVLANEFDAVNLIREKAQKDALLDYKRFERHYVAR